MRELKPTGKLKFSVTITIKNMQSNVIWKVLNISFSCRMNREGIPNRT
jgi:hypothetical protein